MALESILIERFKPLRTEQNIEWQFIDGSIIKAYQHSNRAAPKNIKRWGKYCR